MRAIWVTGLGLVTPLGAGVEATWAALVRGDRGIGPVTLFDASAQRVGLAALVQHVPVTGGHPGARAGSRTSAMALAAAEEAMCAARLDPRASRVGLVIGTTTGGMFETERLLATLHANPSSRRALEEMRCHPLTATGDDVSAALGPFARVRTLSSACSSGANAIVVATAWLRSGEVDAVVAGGADGLCWLTLTGFNALGAIDPAPCRPFDRRRRGTTLGEGAGFLVLEHAERARRRGVEPVAALSGWAIGSEGHHITNPAPDGAVVADVIGRALARAGLSPEDLDYVSAHGTGTTHNDLMEAAALARALGPAIERVPVSSSKGQIGHTLGAAGAIEAAIAALVVARRTLVPTAGLDEPDPLLHLVHVPHVGQSVPRVRAALSNAFGFGGMDTVLVFSEPQGSGGEGTRCGSAAARAPILACDCVITGTAIFSSGGRLGGNAVAVAPAARFDRGAAVDPDRYLDAARSRRLDRTARIGAVAVAHALAQSGADAHAAGIVVGSAYGTVDASAAFLHRVFERGPRFASPAEFPNLVPSSPVGHIAIYLAMHGPSFATSDLGASGESAFVQALQLLKAGEADAVVAGAIDLASDIVDRVLAPLAAPADARGAACPAWPVVGVRSDLAAALVIETDAQARVRGARALARVDQVIEWRGNASAALLSLASLAPPRGAGAEVVLSRADARADELLRMTKWATCPRVECAPAFGEGDAVGAVVLAVAAARVGEGLAQGALVIGLSPAGGYAVVFASS